MSAEKETYDIDLIRFVYDVFTYSALRFGVDEHSIPVWEGSANNYGDRDFIPVVSRPILEHQIFFRDSLYEFFICHYKPHMRNSLPHICKLLSGVINYAAENHEQGSRRMFEFCMFAACEFILFLYSKNSDLFLIQLAEHWFHYYLKPNIKEFKKFGGLHELYVRGRNVKNDVPDKLINVLITTFCQEYEKSVNLKIYKHYFNSIEVFKQKQQSNSSEAHYEDFEVLMHLPRFDYVVVERDQFSELNRLAHPRLRVPPPEEMYDFNLADASTLTQNLRGESDKEPSKRPRTLSYRQRKLNKKLGIRSSEEQGLGELSLDSSGAKKSSEENPSGSIATDTAQSYEHLGAKPKDTLRNRKSSDLNTRKYSEEQDLGQLSLDSSRTRRPIEKKPLPSVSKYLEFPEASGQELSKHTKGSSNKKRKRKKKPSVRPSVEQGLGQLSLNSSGMKQSSEETPSGSIATDTTQSYEHLGAKPKDTLRNRKSSNLQTGEPSLLSSVEEGLGQLSLDSSWMEQSSEKKTDILAADDLSSQNHPTKEQSGSSSGEKEI